VLLGFLLDQSVVGVDLQMMLDHLPMDLKHLRRFSDKHVNGSPEEGDECEFLFVVQITRDTGSLTSFCPDLDGLHGDALLHRGLHTGC
jgi:hypothetical protein